MKQIFYPKINGENIMTDDEFMIGVRERLTNTEQILIATCNEFANINIEDLEDGIKVKKEHLRFLI